jgi:LPS sulfotransferase NodH
VKKVRYIIVGAQRSGTTVVHMAAMGHPNVAALSDEVKINPLFAKGISSFTFGNDFTEEKEKGLSALFNTLTLLLSNDETIAHGCKIACANEKLADTLISALKTRLKDVKVILVVRKDLVAQYGSALSSARTGIFHSWNRGYDLQKIKKIKINRW